LRASRRPRPRACTRDSPASIDVTKVRWELLRSPRPSRSVARPSTGRLESAGSPGPEAETRQTASPSPSREPLGSPWSARVRHRCRPLVSHPGLVAAMSSFDVSSCSAALKRVAPSAVWRDHAPLLASETACARRVVGSSWIFAGSMTNRRDSRPSGGREINRLRPTCRPEATWLWPPSPGPWGLGVRQHEMDCIGSGSGHRDRHRRCRGLCDRCKMRRNLLIAPHALPQPSSRRSNRSAQASHKGQRFNLLRGRRFLFGLARRLL
jgi:hypothetical protein